MHGSNNNAIKDWIRAVARHMQLSPSELGLNAGMAASTMTRFLNRDDVSIKQSTLQKIADYAGFAILQLPDISPFITKADIIPYSPKDDGLVPWMHDAVAAIKKHYPAGQAWIVQNNIMDITGILPGDCLFTDKRVPQNGNIVIGNNRQTGNKVLRIYEAPYLLANSLQLGPQRPLTVDEHLISVDSVCFTVIRRL